jgi:hypothetical protein
MKRLTLVVLLMLFAAVRTQSQTDEPRNESIQDRLTHLGGGAAQILAQNLGITEIAGKPIEAAEGPPGNANAPMLFDVGIGVHPPNTKTNPPSPPIRRAKSISWRETTSSVSLLRPATAAWRMEARIGERRGPLVRRCRNSPLPASAATRC